MQSILIKSTAVAFGSVAVSLAICLTIVPAMGGVVDGNAWLMCILCPLLTAWPASAFTFWQSARLRQAIADLAAAHSALAEANGRLSQKASHDAMTGLLNREVFFERIEEARQLGRGGVLLLIDADHFKAINDEFGHQVGDAALVAIARAMGRAVRSGDHIGRIGGEEFGVFVTGAMDGEAEQVAVRILAEVAAADVRSCTDKPVSLTVSIGGASSHAVEDITALMLLADQRLYEAKRGGRNRLVVAPFGGKDRRVA